MTKVFLLVEVRMEPNQVSWGRKDPFPSAVIARQSDVLPSYTYVNSTHAERRLKFNTEYPVQVRARHFEPEIILGSNQDDSIYICICLGIAGLLLKNSSPRTLHDESER